MEFFKRLLGKPAPLEQKMQEKTPEPAPEERVDPRTPEVAAAQSILTRFFGAEGGVGSLEAEEYSLLVAAARSEPGVLQGVARRLYQDEKRKLKEAGETPERQHEFARERAIEDGQHYGFTAEEIKVHLG